MSSVQGGKKDAVKEFLSTMDEVYTLMMQFPMPIIAAMNGHTFGNGIVIAAACDFRYMRSDKGYVCFPEVDMNIPFVPGLIDVILKAIPKHKFNEMILTGRKMTADEMAEATFIDKTFPIQQKTLMECALWSLLRRLIKAVQSLPNTNVAFINLCWKHSLKRIHACDRRTEDSAVTFCSE